MDCIYYDVDTQTTIERGVVLNKTDSLFDVKQNYIHTLLEPGSYISSQLIKPEKLMDTIKMEKIRSLTPPIGHIKPNKPEKKISKEQISYILKRLL